MAPTGKKRKGKSIVGESSSSVEFDSSRFINELAFQYYTQLLNSSMPRERGFDLEHAKRPLIVQLKNRGWREFIKPPTEAVIPVVREFYANLRVDNDNYDMVVRGKTVRFDSFNINRLYNMPNIDNDAYTAFRQGPIEFDEIIEYLCYPGAVWRLNASGRVMNFQARYLKQAAAAVFLFVIARLMPAKHATDVTKDRAILIYCILQGHSINVGNIISASIMHTARTNKIVSLLHSSLITELCQSAGVEWNNDEDVLRLQVAIKVPTRQTMDADELPTARASGSTSQQANEPRQQQRSLNQRIDALEHKVDNLCLNSSTFMTYVVDFNTALAHQFTNPNMPHPQFPNPPEWHNQEDEGENEDDDEEDDEDDEH